MHTLRRHLATVTLLALAACGSSDKAASDSGLATETTPTGSTSAGSTPTGSTSTGSTPTGSTPTGSSTALCGSRTPAWSSTPPTPPYLLTDRRSYCRGDVMGVRFDRTGDLGPTSFVALGVIGSPDTERHFRELVSIAGATELEIPHLPQSCNLEVRLYLDDDVVLERSAPISVDCGGPEPRVWTDSATYAEGDPVLIEWADAEGWALDWVAVAPVGAPDDGYIGFDYTDPILFTGPYSGSVWLDDFGYTTGLPLPAGDYEARLMRDSTGGVQARSTFTVR